MLAKPTNLKQGRLPPFWPVRLLDSHFLAVPGTDLLTITFPKVVSAHTSRFSRPFDLIMANNKSKSVKGVPSKHLHARTTFLYQAATYLALQSNAESVRLAGSISGASDSTAKPDRLAALAHSPAALQLASHLRAVSLKGQVRLSADIKRSVCKTCNSILITGRTSTHVLENKSHGAKKPWADVLEVECTLCGSKKRFPVGAKRQHRKSERHTSKLTSRGLANKDWASAVGSTKPLAQKGSGLSAGCTR